MEQPLVSICCITYNHAGYIRQCLDGFLMQKTSFSYEIIINDDCSTDGTTDVIREYEERYPSLIVPIYHVENEYSKGVRGMFATYCFPKAKGKYIAMCEGDDYWTDPLKLQKQVDFLESHPDYVMCSHMCQEYCQARDLFRNDWHGELTEGVKYDLNNLIRGEWFYQPLTVVFRKDKFNFKEYSRYPLAMDAVLFYHLLKNGKGYMIPEEMAVYRIHVGGVWSGITYKKRITTEFIARIGIYEVEQSYEAAFFLRNQFTKWIPRSLMLQEWRLMMKSFYIISKHFGVVSTFRLFFSSFLFHRLLKY